MSTSSKRSKSAVPGLKERLDIKKLFKVNFGNCNNETKRSGPPTFLSQNESFISKVDNGCGEINIKVNAKKFGYIKPNVLTVDKENLRNPEVATNSDPMVLMINELKLYREKLDSLLKGDILVLTSERALNNIFTGNTFLKIQRPSGLFYSARGYQVKVRSRTEVNGLPPLLIITDVCEHGGSEMPDDIGIQFEEKNLTGSQIKSKDKDIDVFARKISGFYSILTFRRVIKDENNNQEIAFRFIYHTEIDGVLEKSWSHLKSPTNLESRYLEVKSRILDTEMDEVHFHKYKLPFGYVKCELSLVPHLLYGILTRSKDKIGKDNKIQKYFKCEEMRLYSVQQVPAICQDMIKRIKRYKTIKVEKADIWNVDGLIGNMNKFLNVLASLTSEIQHHKCIQIMGEKKCHGFKTKIVKKRINGDKQWTTVVDYAV